jgi:hypothetical protein
VLILAYIQAGNPPSALQALYKNDNRSTHA